MWILNARTAPRGGGLRTAIDDSEGGRPLSGLTCVVYIHGFNKDADESRRQAETLSRLLHEPISNRRWIFGAYLWPATGRGGRSLLSAVRYPAMIEPARAAGRLLGSHIAQSAHANFILVGHSMGALVALEAATRFTEERGHRDSTFDRIAALVLTGAAVESGELEASGQFGIPRAMREEVLFCPNDLTLRTLFGPGQRLARPFAPVSVAVGQSGLPSTRAWNTERTDVWHHKYWSEPCTSVVVGDVLRGVPTQASSRQPGHRHPSSREVL